jgi:tRNA A-37 threonylcarbamoyl transferase component Bud32
LEPATPAPLANGTLVGGGYRVLGPIADGGMGSVYEAEQIATGARRALKLMHQQLSLDDKLRRQFVQEARVCATIKSDHVAQVVDAGLTDDGHPYMVMELLEGVTMARALRERGCFSWPDVAEILRQLSHGLAAAHDAGIVHRDLKPANVFFADSRTAGFAFMVKALDFGIARVMADASPDAITAVVGTPAWMAPEQTERAARVGPPADVWSLGLLAFALLSGRHFWPSANQKGQTAALLREIVIDAIPTASAQAAGYGIGERIPPGFDGWFGRCVTREPGERYRDARVAFEAFVSLVGPACGMTAAPISGAHAMSSGSWGPAPGSDAPSGGTPEAQLAFDKPTVSYATRPSTGGGDGRRFPRALLVGASFVVAAGVATLGVLTVRRASPPASAAAAPASASAQEHVLVRLHGSNTIGAELAPALAEAFLKRRTGAATVVRRRIADDELRVEARPDAATTPDVVEIHAHGSSTAFVDL